LKRTNCRICSQSTTDNGKVSNAYYLPAHRSSNRHHRRRCPGNNRNVRSRRYCCRAHRKRRRRDDVRTAAEDTVDFTWINAGGIPSSLSDFRGNVVLINFWATWCIPCRKEIPDLISINTELSGNGLTIIGISVDDTEDIARVDMFIEDQEIPYINVLDDGRIAEHIGSIRAVPTTLIIDRDGTVQETIVGVRTKEQFMEKIKRYL
jgi:thiol-disulfide isomerase/thioredoxin